MPACDPSNFDQTPAFTDGCFHQGVWFTPDAAEYDVIILPPTSHNQLRDWQLIEKSLDNWELGVKELGAAWLADGLKINDYTLGKEFIPPEALTDPEVVIALHTGAGAGGSFVGLATYFPLFCHGVSLAGDVQGLPSWHAHPDAPIGHFTSECGGGGHLCTVTEVGPMALDNANDRRIHYDLVSHEIGHCLALGHVGDATTESLDDSVAYPEDDIMSYESDGHHAQTMHCPSNLDVRTIEAAFSDVLGQGGPTRNQVNDGANAVYSHMHPSDWRTTDCEQSQARATDAAWLATFNPLAEDQDAEPVVTDNPRVGISSPTEGQAVSESVITVEGGVNRHAGQPLSAEAGGPYQAAAGTAVAIAGSALGAQGPLTCTWSGPGVFADADACATTLTIDAPGTYAIVLSVSDGQANAQDTAVVTVADEASAATLYFGSQYTRTGAAAVDCGQRYTYGMSTTPPAAGKAYLGTGFAAVSCTTEFVGTVPATTRLADGVTADLFWACDEQTPMALSAGTPAGSTSRILVRLRDGSGALLVEKRYTEPDPTTLVCDSTVRHTPLAITSTQTLAAGSTLKVEVVMFVLTGDPDAQWMEKNLHLRVGGTEASGLILGPAPAGPSGPGQAGLVGPPAPIARPAAAVGGASASTCAELGIVASDPSTDSLAVGAEEVLCIGAGPVGDRFAYSVEVQDATTRQFPARSVWFDFYFQPDFGLLAGSQQLVSVEYLSDGSLAPFWDVGGNDPTGLTFPTFSADPTRPDVTASRTGNAFTVSFPQSYLGQASDGDRIVGLYVDANDCGSGTTCSLRHADWAPEGKDGIFTFGAELLAADAGGPYAGAPGAPISISGSFTGDDGAAACAWTTTDDGVFADADSCVTTVTFATTGSKSLSLDVTDSSGTASDTASVSVSDTPQGERVVVRIGGLEYGSQQVSTSSASPTAPYAIDVNLGGLAGEQTITVDWFDADNTLLDTASVNVTVGSATPNSIQIEAPADESQVEPGVRAVSGSVQRGSGGQGVQASGAASDPWDMLRLGQARKAISFIDAANIQDLTPDNAPRPASSRQGPPVPSPSDGIGPGTPVLSYRGGTVGLCTANYVWKDQAGNYYLGAAGHCFFIGPDEAKVATHGPGADMPDTSPITVKVCIAMCAFGGANLLVDAATGSTVGQAVGDLATLGRVAYARQGPQAYGQDFGLVKIPKELEHLIRPEMPVWNGPVGTWTPPTTDAAILGNPTFVYGNSAGLGETFLTKSRMGTWSFANPTYPGAWVSDTPAFQGDSGAAVNFGARTGTDNVIESKDAMGILTHLYGHPVTAGTMVQKAIDMATEAGLTIDFMREGQSVGGGGGGGTPTAETWYAHQTACAAGQTMDQTDRLGDFEEPCWRLGTVGELGGLGVLGSFPSTVETLGANAGDEVAASVFVAYDETPASLSTVTAVLRADGVEVGRGLAQKTIDPITWIGFGWNEYEIGFELTSGFEAGAALTWQVYHEGSARAQMGYEDDHASKLTILTTRAPPNQPPVADAGPDLSVTEAEPVGLFGACTDPEGALVACAWTQVSGPSVVITDNGDGTASFTAPDVSAQQVLVLRLTATDDASASDVDDVDVTVHPIAPVPEHVEIWIAGSQVAPDAPVGPTGPSNPVGTWTADVDFAPYAGTVVIVEARWMDTDDVLLATDTINVQVADDNAAPTASFEAPSGAHRNSVVLLDAASSSDADGSITGYAWDFGDGQVGEGAQASHAWTSLGTFTITLTVTDDDGATATATRSIVVDNAPPTAHIEGPSQVKKNKVGTFSGASSADPDGPIASYTWDFGDGTSASGATVDHVWRRDGFYDVVLTVRDADGAVATATHTVEVYNGQP